MSSLRIRRIGLVGCIMFGLGVSGALAAGGPTPQQIQGLIAAGHPRAALSDLRPIVRAHPESGVAWYLTAEARDALGDPGEARAALAKAEQLAPGLPFAKPDRVAALKAHLAGGTQTGSGTQTATGAAVPASGFRFKPWMLIVGGLVLLFVILRLRRRSAMRQVGNPYGFGGAPMGPGGLQPPYGPAGGAPYGNAMPGSGMGSALASGLALGVGVAAGERIIDGLTGGERDQRGFDGNVAPDPGADRDDGLAGSPGWDDNAASDDGDSQGDFDPDNNW